MSWIQCDETQVNNALQIGMDGKEYPSTDTQPFHPIGLKEKFPFNEAIALLECKQKANTLKSSLLIHCLP